MVAGLVAIGEPRMHHGQRPPSADVRDLLRVASVRSPMRTVVMRRVRSPTPSSGSGASTRSEWTMMSPSPRVAVGVDEKLDVPARAGVLERRAVSLGQPDAWRRDAATTGG